MLLKLVSLLIASGLLSAHAGKTLQFVFTSDPHFGVNRSVFHEEKNVDARYANMEMVAKINTLPALRFPDDGEPRSGEPIGNFDFVAVGGNIANRMEAASITQSAQASWKEFAKIYLDGLHLQNAQGEKAPVYYMAGAHDVSNAIGYYKRLDPKTDPTVLVEIHNRLVDPAHPLTAQSYDFKQHKPHYSRDVGGAHLVFVSVWPDSTERAWMEQDLAKVPQGTPVILFAHSTPDIDAKYLTNPNGAFDINKVDKFENVVAEKLQGGTKVGDKSSANERGLAEFVKKHPEIKAYFHGGGLACDLKMWMGPDYDFGVPTFSADSPVKGELSGKDESQLSFLVATLDLDARKITVRECRWNADPKNKKGPLQWGNHLTFDFREAPAPVSAGQP